MKLELTVDEAKNVLKLIDRALKSSPLQGGLNDLMAAASLVQKLAAFTQADKPE